MWTVIYHFNRGHSLIEQYRTSEEAFKAIELMVFKDRNCVNFSCFYINPLLHF